MPRGHKISLSEEHIAYLVEDEGCTYKEIAEVEGCHPRTISRYYNRWKKKHEKKNEKQSAWDRIFSWLKIRK